MRLDRFKNLKKLKSHQLKINIIFRPGRTVYGVSRSSVSSFLSVVGATEYPNVDFVSGTVKKPGKTPVNSVLVGAHRLYLMLVG